MLNTNYFTQLAGETHFDDEMRERIAAGENLIDLQVEFHRRGRAEANLVKSIYGWTIRYVSGLYDRSIIAKGFESYEDAVEAGKAWVAQSPNLRSLIVRNSDIPN